MQTLSKNFLYIHLVVLSFAFSSLFGTLITMPALTILLGRIFSSVSFFFIFSKHTKEDQHFSKKIDFMYLALMGTVFLIHWLVFFQSVPLSTIAIGMLTFSNFPILARSIEPYFAKKELKLTDNFIANIVFCAILLILPNISMDNPTLQGIMYGSIAGCTYAVLSLINHTCVKQYQGLVISLYEQAVTTTFLLPFLFIKAPIFTINQILFLMLLGTIFTIAAHTVFIQGFKNVRKNTAELIAYFEPIYGIIIAFLVLQTLSTLDEIFGAIIILSTILYHSSKPSR
ncbi:DMT family transporter [Anaerosinus massiliensis]|uniref:DMT family transporter n=1 Tax=Massilibacillus massiliensis TaxID=1806837 RepID=UPI000DA5EE2D|nr:DMT family transporter [Massilibacillus massiliensis]